MEKQKDTRDSFVKQAGILAAAGIISRIIGLLYRSPLTSIIGDKGNGYYSKAYNVYAIILLIASYSIPSAISKEISQRLALGQKKNADKFFKCSLFYVIVVGGAASIFAFSFSNILLQPNSAMVLRFFAPTIFFSGILGVFRGYFQARRTMVLTSISQIVEQVANAVMSIGMAYILISIMASNESSEALYGAIGSAIGTGSGVVISLLLMFFFVKKAHKKEKVEILTSSEDQNVMSYKMVIRQIILTVTPIILSTCIYNSSTVINQGIYSSYLRVIKKVSEEESSALYGIFAGKSVVIMNIPIALATAMAAAMMPSIAAAFIKGEIEDTKNKINKAINTTLIIAMPSACAFLFVAKPIVQILFPQKESLNMASGLLMCLSVSVIFFSISTITNAVLQATGRVNIPVKNAVISLILQTVVLVGLLLLTNLNLYSLAIASCVYSASMCVLNARSIKQYLGYKTDYVKTYGLPLLASVCMGIVVKVVYDFIVKNINKASFAVQIQLRSIFAFFIATLIGALVYFIVLVKIGGLTKQDMQGLPKGNKIVILAEKMRLI